MKLTQRFLFFLPLMLLADWTFQLNITTTAQTLCRSEICKLRNQQINHHHRHLLLLPQHHWVIFRYNHVGSDRSCQWIPSCHMWMIQDHQASSTHKIKTRHVVIINLWIKELTNVNIRQISFTRINCKHHQIWVTSSIRNNHQLHHENLINFILKSEIPIIMLRQNKKSHNITEMISNH